MKKYIIYLLFFLPFFSSCVSDDCSECADTAYATRIKLQIAWPNNTPNNNSKADDELKIDNFTLFVFNGDNTINTIKHIESPPANIPYSTSLSMTISSTATSIYAIANCADLLSDSPTSSIGMQVQANMSNLKQYLDNSLTIDYNNANILENNHLVHVGYTDIITPDGTNPYNYKATVLLKPVVSKFDIKVTTTATTPADYNTTIQEIQAFVLNSRSKVKLFPNTSIVSDYIHGAYESFWQPYGNIAFPFQNTNSTSANLIGSVSPNSTSLSLFVPENDISMAPIGKTSLVVLKVKYKMISIEGTEEVFYRFLTVPLNPPTSSNLCNTRGTKYNIEFKLSGKYFGSLSPLSSMMQPYSPIPTKTPKNLIYVAPQDYSNISVTGWR